MFESYLQIVSNIRNICFSFEQMIKIYEIRICFRKKTTHYTEEISG